jgi:hypothetical protein
MSRVNLIILCTSLATSAAFCSGQNALAQGQRGVDPNMGHFYMARQQVEILDAGPVVNNRMSPPPQPGQAAPPGGNGALPSGPMPLAPARWQQYSPTEPPPNLSTSLPKVNNGIPKKAPLPSPDRGKPGRMDIGNKAKVVAAPRPTGPATYEPYKKFAVEAPASTSAGSASQGQVYGDVLHWAHRKQH